MSPFKTQIVAALAVLACSFLTVPSFADSQVRIVRLSDVEGSVQINRNQSYEKAFLNLPIVQGNQIYTRSDGRAEVEFEDGSALRLAPETSVGFPQLALTDSGGKVSTVSLRHGTAYLTFKGSKDDQTVLTFGSDRLLVRGPARLRIEVSATNAAVAVLGGEAEVKTPSETVAVTKNHTALFSLADNRSKVTKDVEPYPYDAWNKQQDQYDQRYSNATTANSSPYAYGMADLNYYGSFFNAPGYGMLWQPYLTNADWNPYWDGAWAFYPGMGYGWVSAYPWGWTPFHSGSWIFVPGYGYAWQAGGGGWTAIVTQPRVLNAPAGFSAPKPPATGQGLVVVNRGPVTNFAPHQGSKLIIQNNSAGLGIPRGGVSNLASVSQKAGQQGMVTARIHTAPVETAPLGMPAYAPVRDGLASPSSRTSPASTTSSSAPVHSGGPAAASVGRSSK